MANDNNVRIILYDIPGKAKDCGWSFNIYRVRYLLNHKGISHKTVWVEYPDIKSLFLSLGIPSSGKALWGGDAYTCPSIKYIPDPSTGEDPSPIYVTDSWGIAKFIEAKFPDPPLFGPTNGLASYEDQSALHTAARGGFLEPVFPLLISRTFFNVLNERSKPYFRETRESIIGKTMEAMCPVDGSDGGTALTEAQTSSKAAISNFLKERLSPQFASGEHEFVYGNHVSYVDMCIVSFLKWIELVGHDELWVQVKEQDGGRWARYLSIFDEKGWSIVH